MSHVADSTLTFDGLGLNQRLVAAVKANGYAQPSPIQAQAIPPALTGGDVFGSAQTGTGKTAAFTLPIIQQLTASNVGQKEKRRPIRCLILTPTRELAAQIGESIETYSAGQPISHGLVFGGVGQGAQVAAIKRGFDILVACPGRLLDLLNQQRLHLRDIKHFVLDEADRMLDMGFINDVKKIIAQLPAKRQTLFFSATIPPEIMELANSLLRDPVHVSVAPRSSSAETVSQYVYPVATAYKVTLLKHLLAEGEMSKTVVFTRTKYGADRVARQISKGASGKKIHAVAIHGNKTQNARIRALNDFKSGKAQVLVASDIAARGIDIDDVSHVVNFELPHEPETYVHRIGRTGRAGKGGKAYSFCEPEERKRLRNIERLIKRKIEVINDHPVAHLASPSTPPKQKAPSKQSRQSKQNRNSAKSTGKRKSSDAMNGAKRRSQQSQGRNKKPTVSAGEKRIEAASRIAKRQGRQ